MRTNPKTMVTALVISLCASLTSQAASPVSGQTQVQTSASTPAPIPAPAATVPAAAASVAATVTKSAIASAAPVSVLERFRTYSGPRTPSALSTLFIGPVWAGVRQQPEIVLSNGAVPVNITATISARDNAAPNFAFDGARLMASTKIRKDEWLIVALPETGVTKAELIVLSNGVALDIPLTVAPPLPAGTDLSEKGFAAFLGEKAAAKPLRDLNGDGRQDYIDDYIFTANFLASKLSPPPEHSAGAVEPIATQTSDQQPTPSLEQQIRDLKAAEAAGSTEPKPTGEGQGSVPAFNGGWSSGVGTSATTGGGTTLPGGTGTVSGDYTTTTTEVTTGGTTGGTTGSTAGDATTGTMTTITSPSGKSISYIGNDTRNLNLRNLKAKEQNDLLIQQNKSPK